MRSASFSIRGFEDFGDTTPGPPSSESSRRVAGRWCSGSVLFVDDTAANVRDVAAKGPPGAQTLQAK